MDIREAYLNGDITEAELMLFVKKGIITMAYARELREEKRGAMYD